MLKPISKSLDKMKLRRSFISVTTPLIKCYRSILPPLREVMEEPPQQSISIHCLNRKDPHPLWNSCHLRHETSMMVEKDILLAERSQLRKQASTIISKIAMQLICQITVIRYRNIHLCSKNTRLMPHNNFSHQIRLCKS